MKKYTKYFKKIDVFGTNIELTLNQQKTHKTYFGSFLTVCVVIACFLGSRSIGADFIVKEDPDMLYKDIFFVGQDIVQEWQNLEMLFSIKDAVSDEVINGQELVDLNTIQIKAEYLQTSQTENVSLDIQWLNDGMAFKINPSTFQKIINFKNIIITVTGQSLQNFLLQIQYNQFIFRSDIYENPFLSQSKDNSFPLNNIGLEMVFSYTEVSTDRGVFVPNYNSQQQLLYTEKYPIQNNLSDLDYNSSSFVFSINNVSRFYKRKYLKVQNILAIIGGLLKSLLVVGKFISKPISKLSIRSRLLNELFNFADLQALQHSHSQLNLPPAKQLNEKSKSQKERELKGQIINEIKQNQPEYKEEMKNIKINSKDPNDKESMKMEKKNETQYFELIKDEGNKLGGQLDLNKIKSNFQIQLQSQIQKNIVSQKSLQSRRLSYINQNSKQSGFSYQSSQNQQKGLRIATQQQINTQNTIYTNQLNQSKQINQRQLQMKSSKNEMMQHLQKKIAIYEKTANQVHNDKTNQTQNISPLSDRQINKQIQTNILLLQKKKSFQSKHTNSMKPADMFEISEAPLEQEQKSRIKPLKMHSAKVNKSNQNMFTFPSPPSNNYQLKQDKIVIEKEDDIKLEAKVFERQKQFYYPSFVKDQIQMIQKEIN